MSKKGYKMKGMSNGDGDGKRQAKTIETGGIKSSPLFPRLIEAGISPHRVDVSEKDKLEYALKKTLRSQTGFGQEIMDEYKPMLVTRLIERQESPTPQRSPTPRQEMVRSTPLQERQSFDTPAEIKLENLSFKNTAIQKLND